MQKNASQFDGFCDERLQFALLDVFAFADYLEPDAGLGEFFHGNLKFVNEVLARFGFRSFGVVCGNACRGTEYLVSKTAAANQVSHQGDGVRNAIREEADHCRQTRQLARHEGQGDSGYNQSVKRMGIRGSWFAGIV